MSGIQSDYRVKVAWGRVQSAFRDYENVIADYSATEERELTRLIEERDNAIEWADKLANELAPSHVVGEHSNANDPWRNALEYAKEMKIR